MPTLAARAFASCALASLASLASIGAAAPARAATPTPIDGLGADVASAFWTTNIFLFGGAVLVTGAMAQGGVDHSTRVAVQRQLAAPTMHGAGDAALYAGYLVPAITAPALYLFGLARGDDDATGAGAASLQALAVTVAATSLLKWSTGRAYPLNGGDPASPDRLEHPAFARTFTPFEGGLAAWPSGHTSAMVALVAALHAYAPGELAVPVVGYPLAGAVGVGMIMGDRHWASDVLAGALLGQAVGGAVGDAFRVRRVSATKDRGGNGPSLRVGAVGPSMVGVSGVF